MGGLELFRHPRKMAAPLVTQAKRFTRGRMVNSLRRIILLFFLDCRSETQLCYLYDTSHAFPYFSPGYVII